MIDLAVVIGATATGKTGLGVELAERIGGEVVSADAFAVYRGLDIGTAKPSPAVRRRVPHHLIDIADPRERYSAGAFIRDADAAIADIRRRGRVPIVVGGTLFYVRSLLHGLFPEPPRDPALRRFLEELWRREPALPRRWLELLDEEAAGRWAPADRQRTLRALEVALVAGRPLSALWRAHAPTGPRYRALVMGMALPREALHARIALRVEGMFASGLLEEVRGLLASGVSPGAHALKAIGYRECCRVLLGEMTVDEASRRTEVATRQLAKRQMTWLRAESGTVWLPAVDAEAVVAAVSHVEAQSGTGTGPAQG